MAEEIPPNQGAPGDVPPTETAPDQGAPGDVPATEAPAPEAGAAEAGQSPLAAQRAAATGLLDERPEILVGAAFVGGFVLAKLLGLLGRK